MTLPARVEDFLAQPTLAIIGLSRNEKHFSRQLLRALLRAGRFVLGVNPLGGSIDGEACTARIVDLPDGIGGALLMLPPAEVAAAVRECADAGIPRIWIYGTGQPAALDHDTLTVCRERGVELVNGLCPLMFLHGSAWPHRLHGWIVQRSRRFRAASV